MSQALSPRQGTSLDREAGELSPRNNFVLLRLLRNVLTTLLSFVLEVGSDFVLLSQSLSLLTSLAFSLESESFLLKFFRNLLLGEKHVLKSRFAHVRAACCETEQEVEHSRPSIIAVDPYVGELLKAIGGALMSVREMMEVLGLKGRDNFLKKYLNPAVAAGCIGMLYPDNPRHPRQKYRLTARGALAWQDLHR